eukprot:4220868-Amphidinium_carterae.1
MSVHLTLGCCGVSQTVVTWGDACADYYSVRGANILNLCYIIFPIKLDNQDFTRGASAGATGIACATGVASAAGVASAIGRPIGCMALPGRTAPSWEGASITAGMVVGDAAAAAFMLGAVTQKS